MNSKSLVKKWFDKWLEGDFHNLPVSENFQHTSPFGIISGKKNYVNLVESNKDKFLGYRFDIQDEIYDEKKACVRYRAIQRDFTLDVSEWYYFKNNLIEQIYAYYHIGVIREDRKLTS